MQRIFRRLGYLALATLVLAGARPARADAVIEWNELMQRTVLAGPGSNPLFQARWSAITQLAVFEAVNSITGDYEPYLGTIVAPAGASQGAAVASAAYSSLISLRPPSFWAANPSLLADLTLEYNQSLAAATLEDGPASVADGILVGHSAAVAMLALRANDGSAQAPGYPYTPGTGPGYFRPIGAQIPALPGWGFVHPFGLNSGSQFPAPPPPALNSGRYVADFNEVKLVGRAGVNPFRPLDRENAAFFYNATTPVEMFNSAARQVMSQQGIAGAQAARIFALLGMAIADASIACWDNKYTYNFWRPQAAIREALTDGNDKTEADPIWTPLLGTPAHPSYGSGHGSLCGAARVVLEQLLGEAGHIIQLTTPSLPGMAFEYTAWSQITDDVSDARIYGGIHFRFDQEAGALQGRKVGNYMLSHYLRSPDEE